MKVDVVYKYIDGAHFFVAGDKQAAGLCVAHKDLAIAYAEVGQQLTSLFAFNHGINSTFTPVIPFDKFQKFLNIINAAADAVDGDAITTASMPAWLAKTHMKSAIEAL